jgi:PHD/YefM family antitoxin component YafN of YafNO toxin-antitoxin module
MNFYTVRDLRSIPKTIWTNLAKEGKLVITNNGKPAALMLDISEGNFEETIKAVQQAKAMLAFNSMRTKAARRGFMSDKEINAEIEAFRKGKK